MGHFWPMTEASSGSQDSSGSPSSEEVALVLQRVVCPVGLAPGELAKRLESLTPLLEMEWVKGQMQSLSPEEAARAVVAVVKEAVARLTKASHGPRSNCCW